MVKRESQQEPKEIQELGPCSAYKIVDPTIQKAIYVGMTNNIQQCLKQHQRQSKWWRSDLLIEILDEMISRQRARERVIYWIRYYAERGHPLQNQKSRPHLDTDRFMILTQLGADTDAAPSEEMEEIIQYFFRGWKYDFANHFMYAPDLMDVHLGTWEQLFFTVRAVVHELENRHHFEISDVDIARLTAKAVGMEIQDEVES